MRPDAAKSRDGRPRRWTKLFRWLGAATGLITLGLGAGASTSLAQRSDFQSASAAPAAWQAFAKQLQSQFQQQLAAEDAMARRVREGMAKRGTAAGATPPTAVVRAWILPSGRVERVAFDGLDPDMAAELRALLVRDNVGTPPADMLQPVHLRLSLRPQDPPEQQQ